MQRRQFVKFASLTTASLPFISIAKNRKAGSANEATDALFNLFVQPPGSYRPFVRWWWNGDRVTKEEVLRELDVMQEAGIGGVEINPIKWPENADAIGIKELSWGSPEWLDVVETAVKGAKEKGMVCDMIVGSGWPFGGEFVPRSEQGEIIALGTKNLEGGKKVSLSKKELLDGLNLSLAFGNENNAKELFLLRLAPGVMNSFTAGTDLNSQLGKDEIIIDVPEGAHVLYFLVKITGFSSVIQGALGANGPVINHYNGAAVENYLNGFGKKLTTKLGRLDTYFRAFFTDSIELEGANWCSDMFEQFKKRRGYDLVPYFPYILFKTGAMGNAVDEVYGSTFGTTVKELLNRVRYDFEITKHELFQERFVQTFAAWCRKQGVQSRMQAYGMDCDPIQASMLIDIPECETWIWVPEVEEFGEKGKGRNYTMINKFVSSAAHLNGRQLISCEEMTNTGQIFNTTLERVKVTGDQSNLSGVTHSILHGFNYSPLEAPFPGWIRYGSFFNERNTWWPYFRLWADYKARLSCLLQNSVMQANVAVLHPLADLASRYGFQRDPFPNVVYPSYVHQVWEAIHQNGCGCDYISEFILQQAAITQGTLTYNRRSYTTLVLIEVETIAPATAEALKKFADAGGRIVFIAKAPHIASGLLSAAESGKKIKDISNKVLAKHPATTGVVAAPGNDMISWFADIMKRFSIVPYITIDKPVYHVSQLYYKDAGHDIFYFVNYSAQHPHRFTAKFDSRKTPWLWNAETGERKRYPVNSKGELEISLGTAETKLIVFDDRQDGEVYHPVDRAALKEVEIVNNWQLTLNHVNGTVHTMPLGKLADLKQMPPFKSFAGYILYRATLSLAAIKNNIYLDLGKQYDVTELEVNGRPAGVKWYGHHLYDITKLVRPGDNYISIKLTTVLGNYTKSLTHNKAAQEWSQDEVSNPIGLTGQVKIMTGG